MRRNNLIRIGTVAGTSGHRALKINYEKKIEESVYRWLQIAKKGAQQLGAVRLAALLSTNERRALLIAVPDEKILTVGRRTIKRDVWKEARSDGSENGGHTSPWRI